MSPSGPADRAFRADLRRRLLARLASADLLLPTAAYAAYRREVERDGRRLVRGIRDDWRKRGVEGGWTELASWTGSSLRSFPRILGFGHRQAVAIGGPLGLSAPAADEAGRLGGLFNLGVSLFDRACDRSAAHRRRLLSRVTPQALAREAAGSPAPSLAPGSGAAGLDLLCDLIATYFDGVRRLALRPDIASRLHATLDRMYRAETATAVGRRARGGARPEVWSHLRSKSVMPFEAMALVAHGCARPEVDVKAHPATGDGTRGERVIILARRAGHACWLVDDLCDVVADWDAGTWSRPWYRLYRRAHRRDEDLPVAGEGSAGAALEALAASGIVTSETDALVRTLRSLRDACRGTPGAEPLYLCFLVTVQSWILGLPEPTPTSPAGRRPAGRSAARKAQDQTPEAP